MSVRAEVIHHTWFYLPDQLFHLREHFTVTILPFLFHIALTVFADLSSFFLLVFARSLILLANGMTETFLQFVLSSLETFQEWALYLNRIAGRDQQEQRAGEFGSLIKTSGY